MSIKALRADMNRFEDIDPEALLHRAKNTAFDNLREAVAVIDEQLGVGTAKAHPELVIAHVQAVAADFLGCMFKCVVAASTRDIEGALDRIASGTGEIAEAIDKLADAVSNTGIAQAIDKLADQVSTTGIAQAIDGVKFLDNVAAAISDNKLAFDTIAEAATAMAKAMTKK
jgi:hypothetical protein